MRDAAEDFSFVTPAGDPKSVGATMPKVKNPHVFMDISIGGGSAERITFEVVKLAAACVFFVNNGSLFSVAEDMVTCTILTHDDCFVAIRKCSSKDCGELQSTLYR